MFEGCGNVLPEETDGRCSVGRTGGVDFRITVAKLLKVSHTVTNTSI